MVGWHTDSMNMNLGKVWEMVRNREAWRAATMELQGVGHGLAMEQQQQWKESQVRGLRTV